MTPEAVSVVLTALGALLIGAAAFLTAWGAIRTKKQPPDELDERTVNTVVAIVKALQREERDDDEEPAN